MKRAIRSESIKSLSEISSRAYTVSNRYWIALVAVAVVTLFPKMDADGIALPFDLGQASESEFFGAGLVMLLALTLAFASAHAQAHRAHQAGMRMLGRLKPDAEVDDLEVHPRDLYDLMLEPTLNRAGPLSQMFRGYENQLFPGAATIPRWRRYAGNFYFVMLKLVGIVFYLVIPGYAIINCYRAANLSGFLASAARFGMTTAGIAIFLLFIWECLHIARVLSVSVGAKPNS